MRSRAVLTSWAFAALCAVGGSQVRADVVIYSDVTTFTGQGYAGGGSAASGGNTISRTVADDITTAAGTAGNVVDGFTFSTANFNSVAVSARPIVEFWAADGSGGGPGTLLAGLTFNPISFTAGSVQTFNFIPDTPLFNVPANSTFWAGVTFDNNGGGTGAAAAQLNLLGQGLFSPPTVGSSQDVFFQSTAGGAVPGSNPAGSFLFFGGTPPADFGWQFLSPSPVPEPGSACLIGIGCLVAAGYGLKKRRARTTQAGS